METLNFKPNYIDPSRAGNSAAGMVTVGRAGRISFSQEALALLGDAKEGDYICVAEFANNYYVSRRTERHPAFSGHRLKGNGASKYPGTRLSIGSVTLKHILRGNYNFKDFIVDGDDLAWFPLLKLED